MEMHPDFAFAPFEYAEMKLDPVHLIYGIQTMLSSLLVMASQSHLTPFQQNTQLVSQTVSGQPVPDRSHFGNQVLSITDPSKLRRVRTEQVRDKLWQSQQTALEPSDHCGQKMYSQKDFETAQTSSGSGHGANHEPTQRFDEEVC